MKAFRLEPIANASLDDIYDYTLTNWGADQAKLYIEGLFDEFAAIADDRVPSRPVPKDVATLGFVRRWKRHFIYWKPIDSGIAIVAVLHERQAQDPRIAGLFDPDS